MFKVLAESGTFSLWDFSTWEFIVIITIILSVLLLSNLLIKAIKPLRKALIPSPVLGGFIFLGILAILKAIAKGDGIDGSALDDFIVKIYNILEIITFQCLGLGFAATALKQKETTKEESKGAKKDIFNASLVCVSGYIIQAVVGVIIGSVLYVLIHSWPASGLLVPMGYGQGPAQALNWGVIYSQYSSIPGDLNYSQFGPFKDGDSFGLAIAALGFIASSIGGIIYLNVERKKGNVKMTTQVEAEEKRSTIDKYELEGEIGDSESIDKSTVEIALTFVAYILSYLIILGISKLCDMSGNNFLVGTVKPLFWGFNFIVATGMGSIIKMIINKLRKKGVIKKEYINNYMLDRLSGFSFDLMVVAAIGAINLDAFKEKEFIIPLLAYGVAAAVATYFYTKFMCDYLYPSYKEEMFLAMYGMLTGTASTGVILLREIDPEFKTRAQSNLILQPIITVALGAPILLSLSSASKSWPALFIWLAVYIVMLIGFLVLSRRDIIKAKHDAKKATQTEVKQ